VPHCRKIVAVINNDLAPRPLRQGAASKAYIEREGGRDLIARVRALRNQRPRLLLREIAAEPSNPP
jgi:hypothetical protein